MQKLILIDAGHGGIDRSLPEPKQITPGRTAWYPELSDVLSKQGHLAGGQYIEGVFNRNMAQCMAKAAAENGIYACPIFHMWQDTPLDKRLATAKFIQEMYGAANNNTLLISIHSNASDNKNANGIEVFRNRNAGKNTPAYKIAKQINGSFAQLGLVLRKDDEAGKTAGFRMLSNANMPSLLIEFGFHTNKGDVEKILTNEALWADMAKVVVSAMHE